MNTQYLTEKFAAALPYAEYVATGKDEHQQRWATSFESSRLTEPQMQLLAGFTRQMHMLVVSGIWCGDCAFQCPLMQRIALGNSEKIQLRFLDRDLHKDLSEQLKINGGVRVPSAIFMAEDFEFCANYGERPLSRYRALARKKLGQAMQIGGAVAEVDEQAATLADWLNEFERIQLMLRISPRLRLKHAD
jgi:hypothetical protein